MGYSTSAGYDALNRPGCRSYSDSTPAVTLTYDSNLTISDPSGQFPEVSSTNYPKGRLVRASNSVSTTTYRYDAVGRVRSSAQATDGQTYLFGYSYNLFGMTAMRYPSTRLLSYGYDAAGRVNQVGSYATGIQYAAHGAVSQMTLGNGVVETTSYNSRLQTISIASGTLFQIGYGYGTNASSNNGNLISQTITAAGHTFNQSYTYDQFNRVASAAEGSNWARAFGYDRWGNMWVVSGSGVPIDSFTARDPSAYNAQNRRVDVEYDAAGNQTAIGGYTWAYDAEGRLKTSTINGATATYYYDAEGRRVKRVLPVGTTVYVYDAGGNLAAEYGYAEPGARCTTCYLTADHLGSTRMLTAQDGNLIVEDPGYIVKSLHDYIPFGEEVQAGVGGRSSTYYVSQPLAINDGTTIKFTGKEREGENGAWLDYFGARYYASVQGRFTSPDAPLVDQHVEHPQSWNLYAYVRNNPLRLIDPTGHWAEADQAERAYACRVDVVGCENQEPRLLGPRKLPSGDEGPIQRVGNVAVGWIKQTISDALELMSLPAGKTETVEDLQVWLEPTNRRQQAGANARLLAGVYLFLRPKPVSLPSWRKVTVNMEHIAERHMVGGRLTEGRDVFVNLNEQGVMAAIRQAYASASVVSANGERVVLEGVTKTGMNVRLVLNKATKVIETAFPKGN